jgi:hypothetical protein
MTRSLYGPHNGGEHRESDHGQDDDHGRYGFDVMGGTSASGFRCAGLVMLC